MPDDRKKSAAPKSNPQQPARDRDKPTKTEEAIDDTVEESFPASDPPSTTGSHA